MYLVHSRITCSPLQPQRVPIQPQYNQPVESIKSVCLYCARYTAALDDLVHVSLVIVKAFLPGKSRLYSEQKEREAHLLETAGS